MEKIEVISDSLHRNLTSSGNRLVVDNGEIVKIIFDYHGDYKLVEVLTMRIVWLEHVMVNTKYIWMRNIISRNIAKLEEKIEKCFGTCTPPGTPTDSSCSDDEDKFFGTCSPPGTPTESSCSDGGHIIFFQGKVGSPTCTPPSCEEI